jgi:hypothetical protein
MYQSSGVGLINGSVKAGGFWQGFVPCPMALFCGMTPEQVLWQQQIYQRAYSDALAAIGVQPLKVPAFGPDARN